MGLQTIPIGARNVLFRFPPCETVICSTDVTSILIVEDEVKVAEFLRKALTVEGFSVDICHRGDEALEKLLAMQYNGIVLDIMLPGKDGLTVLRELRGRGNSTPVLLLSARSHVTERVDGLNAGADDYLAKPFVLEELTARVKALCRRSGDGAGKPLRLGNLVLEMSNRTAQRGLQRLELSAREFRLLEYLIRRAGQVCSRMEILEKVWDYHFDPGTNLVDVAIRRLRDRIGGADEPPLIHTVRGQGYMMSAPI
jgi:DNA-binding response OmpR family regulator